jgi:hypothetical protein
MLLKFTRWIQLCRHIKKYKYYYILQINNYLFIFLTFCNTCLDYVTILLCGLIFYYFLKDFSYVWGAYFYLCFSGPTFHTFISDSCLIINPWRKLMFVRYFENPSYRLLLLFFSFLLEAYSIKWKKHNSYF